MRRRPSPSAMVQRTTCGRPTCHQPHSGTLIRPSPRSSHFGLHSDVDATVCNGQGEVVAGTVSPSDPTCYIRNTFTLPVRLEWLATCLPLPPSDTVDIYCSRKHEDGKISFQRRGGVVGVDSSGTVRARFELPSKKRRWQSRMQEHAECVYDPMWREQDPLLPLLQSKVVSKTRHSPSLGSTSRLSRRPGERRSDCCIVPHMSCCTSCVLEHRIHNPNPTSSRFIIRIQSWGEYREVDQR